MAATWEELIGKHVLIGITYVDDGGDVVERRQRHGVVIRADDDGVEVREGESGEVFSLPPDLDAFGEAAEGEYRLRETGEIVVDPDLLATWTVRRG